MEPINENSACFFTQQLFLIGTYDPDGASRFAPYSWISFTAGPPKCLVLSTNNNERKKNTPQNIERTGMFSATVVTPDLLPFAEQRNLATSGSVMPASHAMEEGKTLHVPLLAGVKWSYECEVIEHVTIGGSDTYFGAFRRVNVREDIQTLDFIDIREINPVVYAPWHYFTIGQHLGEIGDFSL
ncbi:MAG TPA: flavin reductase [Candidatus Limiplasma sp.]|nr:flavin reductase [Candidatus Limiplasma sp.]HPS81581.1 flavin reductase [Candidatus Limiplasma sp.]